MQTQAVASAANFLLQSAEAVLPKQKRGLAVTEYKHAVVAYKRRPKSHQEGEGISLLNILFKDFYFYFFIFYGGYKINVFVIYDFNRL